MKLISALAAAVGHTAYAYAGAHLGGLLHAGPIPWDDDADMAMLRSGGDLEVTGFLTIDHVTFHPSRTTPIDFILVILSLLV